MPLVTIPEAVQDIQQGKFVIIVDDADRENEGDLAMAASKVTPEHINFMASYARGLICMSIPGERLDELELPLMVPENTARHGTAFTISVDAKHGASTGISAHDRAATVKAILDPKTKPQDLARPGHLFPLRYCQGGVLERDGHTEAIVDLSIISGLTPAGLLCEVLREDGRMARLPYLEDFGQKHNISIISIAQIIEHIKNNQ